MNVDQLLPGLGFGALIGLALGSLGAGGSILTVPILVYALGLPVQAATGTSLAIVGLNSAAGAVDYLRRGRALPRTAVAFGGSGLAGALAGAWLNHQVRGDLVLVLFAFLMLGAAYGLIRRQATAPGEDRFAEKYTAAGWLRMGVTGLVVGFLTGFFGVGGGFLIVPALVLVVGLPMHYAVGTSLLAIAINAVWGLLGHLGYGDIDWGLTALFVVGGILGVLVGGKVAGRVPENRLRLAFAVLIVGIAVYTFIRSLSALLTA